MGPTMNPLFTQFQAHLMKHHEKNNSPSKAAPTKWTKRPKRGKKRPKFGKRSSERRRPLNASGMTNDVQEKPTLSSVVPLHDVINRHNHQVNRQDFNFLFNKEETEEEEENSNVREMVVGLFGNDFEEVEENSLETTSTTTTTTRRTTTTSTSTTTTTTTKKPSP